MMQNHLDQLIKKFGNKIVLNKWEFLFKAWEEDFSLYFLETWNISLEKSWNVVVSISAWEIIWEKWFVEREVRPLDAKILENESVVYKLDSYDFAALDHLDRELIIYSLISFISKRVYSLNDVLSFISYINNKILDYVKTNDRSNYEDLFTQISSLEWYLVLKYEYWEIQKIDWNANVDQHIYWFVDNIISGWESIKVWKNYIFIKADQYIFVLFWEPKLKYYVLFNALVYANSMFRYLWQTIEDYKNKQILNSLN